MIFTGTTLTLLEMVQCELARGDLVYVELLRQDNKELLQLSVNPVEEAVSFLRRQAAAGRILRIFPREHYIAAHAVEHWLKGPYLVRMGNQLYWVDVGASCVPKSRIKLDSLMRKDRSRIVLAEGF
jgi:hypothetical protein